MACVEGYVEKIVFRNEENGYSVLSVVEGKKEYCLVGTFLNISEGEYLKAEGVELFPVPYGGTSPVEGDLTVDREELVAFIESHTSLLPTEDNNQNNLLHTVSAVFQKKAVNLHVSEKKLKLAYLSDNKHHVDNVELNILLVLFHLHHPNNHVPYQNN